MGVGAPHAGVCDLGTQGMERGTKTRGVGSEMSDENLLVILGTPDDQCGHQRCADAAADVAHEVDDSRYAGPLLFRNSDVPRGRYRNEKKSDSYYLRDAQPGCETEAD